jgi:hypothetical protein
LLFHDAEDGAWQFFSADKIEHYEEVAIIIGLGEIISIDKSVLEIADLPLGYCAFRNSIDDEWTISKTPDE